MCFESTLLLPRRQPLNRTHVSIFDASDMLASRLALSALRTRQASSRPATRLSRSLLSTRFGRTITMLSCGHLMPPLRARRHSCKAYNMEFSASGSNTPTFLSSSSFCSTRAAFRLLPTRVTSLSLLGSWSAPFSDSGCSG